MKLIDCPVLFGSNGPWARLTSRPVLDREERATESRDPRLCLNCALAPGASS
jgi:hypothetical protein